jgi:hypothetical protein
VKQSSRRTLDLQEFKRKRLHSLICISVDNTPLPKTSLPEQVSEESPKEKTPNEVKKVKKVKNGRISSPTPMGTEKSLEVYNNLLFRLKSLE